MTSDNPVEAPRVLRAPRDPQLLDEYVERHTPVWPEMLAEIAASGRRNYSLFLARGGRLIGYYETDDDAAAQAYLAASPVAAAGRPRWAGSSSASTAAPTRPRPPSPRSSTSKTSSPRDAPPTPLATPPHPHQTESDPS